ncbi:MAG: DUF4407 domain-containing protein [Roseibacillus sp.]|nr:DUF4407 domain-containing protein [Roseibacillus sp.]
MPQSSRFQASFRRLFFWLSGASSESLESCPDWEQRKYVAFGATVLVPTAFAIMACSYALSTLTADWRVIVPVALVWGFIILTIDRALLATYRPYQSFFRKISQFSLRIVVALLMGLSISHPLALLLFKDTVSSVIEEEREQEIAELRHQFTTNQGQVAAQAEAIDEKMNRLRDQRDATFEANFIIENDRAGEGAPTEGLDAAEQAELQQSVTDATKTQTDRLAAIETQSATLQVKYEKLQGELNFWQTEFEREINGQRSGIRGLGPRARSIKEDQLSWRRAETKRLSAHLTAVTNEAAQVRELMNSIDEQVTTEFMAAGAIKAEAIELERKRVATLQNKVQEQQVDLFVEQQKSVRVGIDLQIASHQRELDRLHAGSAALDNDERTRTAAIMAEPRRDILTQTMALHGLFKAGVNGGQFALVAYLVLAGLFMLIDTIPLVVKFFSKPGPYDTLVDCDEVRFEKEREAFLNSYERYMDNLEGGGLLLATKNRPLERALVDGVDRSRAAKEFLESLMSLERSFEANMEEERERIASKPGERAEAHASMLEEMAQTFYEDLRGRMESFFSSGGGGTPQGTGA